MLRTFSCLQKRKKGIETAVGQERSQTSPTSYEGIAKVVSRRVSSSTLRKPAVRWALISAAVLVAALAIWKFMGSRAPGTREDILDVSSNANGPSKDLDRSSVEQIIRKVTGGKTTEMVSISNTQMNLVAAFYESRPGMVRLGLFRTNSENSSFDSPATEFQHNERSNVFGLKSINPSGQSSPWIQFEGTDTKYDVKYIYDIKNRELYWRALEKGTGKLNYTKNIEHGGAIVAGILNSTQPYEHSDKALTANQPPSEGGFEFESNQATDASRDDVERRLRSSLGPTRHSTSKTILFITLMKFSTCNIMFQKMD